MTRTYQDWKDSGKSFNNFLKEGDVINEELLYHIKEDKGVTSYTKDVVQVGEPICRVDDPLQALYTTFTETRDANEFTFIGYMPDVIKEPFQCSSCGYNYSTCACKSLHF